MPVPLPVRDATSWDVDGIALVLTATATRTPLGRWLYPDALDRDRELHAFFTTWTAATIGFGQVRIVRDTSSRIVAAALWMTCPHAGDPTLALTVPNGREPGRRSALQTRLAGCHPAPPHDHLLALAVLPNLQRTRIGTALITDGYERASKLPAAQYTMALSPDSTLFQRLGYVPADTGAGPSPSGCPPLRPLWRPNPYSPVVLRRADTPWGWRRPNEAPPDG